MLRFSTAGSVDDGKSTLIGRLLYDTQSVYDDQVRSIQGKGIAAPGLIDFSLLTDGLRAEREQGITIDVAYRYFSTPRRKYIIADTPGHEQYTRNMATGASTADAAVVLIDARKGVLVQSRRHAYIASLLGVRHIVVAINKMDLVDYNEQVFREIKQEFSTLLTQISKSTQNVVQALFIPVSALLGENVVQSSAAMPWYDGPSLLDALESLPSAARSHDEPFRMTVQRVIRPDQDFRGFAGQIASGTIRPGNRIIVLPSGHSARIERIVTYNGDLAEASAPLSVTLVLDRDLDVSRGDLLADPTHPAYLAQSFDAAIVWMDLRPLEISRRYLLKHGCNTVSVSLERIVDQVDIRTLSRQPADTLQLNSIGTLRLQAVKSFAMDSYKDNRSTGAFILIDPDSNSTVAAGMIIVPASADESKLEKVHSRVTDAERITSWGQRGGILYLSGPQAFIDGLERFLFEAGAITIRAETIEQREWAKQSGLIAITVSANEDGPFTARMHADEVTLPEGEAGPAVWKLLLVHGVVTNKLQRGS